MSISEFFNKVRSAVVPKPTQHDLAMKAMLMAAAGATRQRRPKRNLHKGQLIEIGKIERKKKGGGTELAPVYYQPTIDSSCYGSAH